MGSLGWVSLWSRWSADHLYRNSLLILVNTFTMAFFGFLFWAIASHMIPANQIGLATSMISGATLVMTIARLGLTDGLIRHIPKSPNAVVLYNSVMIVVSAAALVGTLIFVASLGTFTPELAFLYGTGFFLLFLLYNVLYAVNYVQNSALIALRRGDVALLQNLFLALRVPLIVVIAYLGVFGILFAYSLVYLLAFLFGALVLARLGVPFKPALDSGEIRGILTFSLGSYVTNILDILPSSLMPLMIVGLLGAKESAYFFVAYSLILIIALIPYSVSTSLFIEGSYGMALRTNASKAVIFTLILTLPVCIVFLLFGDTILMLFGAEYSTNAFTLLRYMTVASVLSVVPVVYTAIKKIQKDITAVCMIGVVNSVLLFGASYLLMKSYGLTGIGYAWLATNTIVCILVILMVIFKDRWFMQAITVPPSRN